MCVCVYLCYGVYVLYTDWLVKQPNKATVSQTQSTNHQYHPFKAQDPLPPPLQRPLGLGTVQSKNSHYFINKIICHFH